MLTHYERALAPLLTDPNILQYMHWFTLPKTEIERDDMVRRGEVVLGVRLGNLNLPGFSGLKGEREVFIGAGLLFRFMETCIPRIADSTDLMFAEHVMLVGQHHLVDQITEAHDPLSFIGALSEGMLQGLLTCTAQLGEQAGLNPRAMVTTYVMHLHALSFVRCGKPSYQVSPGLAQKLMLTELRGLKCSDFRLPYPTVYLEVPEALQLGIANEVTGTHRLSGVYLTEDTHDDAVMQRAELKEQLASWDPKYRRAGRSIRVMLCGVPNNQSVFGPGDDALQHFWVVLPDDVPLVEVVDQGAGKLSEINLEYKERDKLLMRWIVNTMFYATNPEAERETVIGNAEARALWQRHAAAPKGPKKRAAILSEFRKKDPQERTILGKSVLLDRTLPRSADELAEHHRANGPLSVRVLVSGHWRRFATGAGRIDRTWKFVDPHWRGPEGTPESTPVHVLGRS